VEDLVAIYVQDHLALSLGGVRLAQRALRENRDGPFAEFLGRFAGEIQEDRDTLKVLAGRLGGARSYLKEAVVFAGELAGRLKLNGRLLGYSPLSRLWELEGLMAGTDSRRGLWKVLARAQKRDRRLEGFDFERLEARARAHREELDRLRTKAADLLLGAGGRTPRGRAERPAPEPAR
jgi:hypothetical protein